MKQKFRPMKIQFHALKPIPNKASIPHIPLTYSPNNHIIFFLSLILNERDDDYYRLIMLKLFG